MSFTSIIAIDPGKSGGLAWNSYGQGIQACPMPVDEEHVVGLLREILQANVEHRIVVYMELVTGYAGSKGGEECPACHQPKAKGEPGSRMFTFGRGVGVLCGALRMAGIEPVEVSPRTWQKPFYVSVTKPSGQRKSRSERKRILHDIAQRRFPQLQVTLKTADALLIHAYAGMQVGQELEGLEVQERPSIPVAFTDPHVEHFSELKQAVARVPGNGKEPAKNRNGAGLEPFYVANWSGTNIVIARTQTGSYEQIRIATPADVTNLPKLPA